jgi:hypothetical protein
MAAHPVSSRDLLLALVTLVLALVGLGTASAVIPQRAPSLAAAKERGVLLNMSIDMTCFPTLPPAPGTPIVLDLLPPRNTAGIDAYASMAPSGRQAQRPTPSFHTSWISVGVPYLVTSLAPLWGSWEPVVGTAVAGARAGGSGLESSTDHEPLSVNHVSGHNSSRCEKEVCHAIYDARQAGQT